MKILVIRFSSLGDIVLSTPVPRVLKKTFPLSQVDMIVRSDFIDLIKNNPYITKKIGFDKGSGIKGLWKLYRKIKTENYDLIVDIHRSLRSRILCLLLCNVKKVYFNKKYIKRFLLINLKINFMKGTSNILEYIKPLNVFGIEYDFLGTEIFIDDATNKKIDKLVDNLKNKKLIGIVPGAKWPGKRWNKFNELAKSLSENYNIVLIGGKSDLNHGIKEKENIKSFIGKLSILESAALLSRCDLAITGDTGMMHVSEAVGTDVITIMGSTSSDLGFAPYREKSRVIELDMWCRPCSKNGKGFCLRKGKRPCLTKITVSDVVKLVKDYFNKK